MRSIRKINLVSFGLILLMLGLLHIFVFVPALKGFLVKNANHRVYEVVKNSAQHLDNYLNVSKDYMVAISKLFDHENLNDSQKAQDFLNKKSEMLLNFDNGLVIFNKKGDLVAEYPFISPERIGENFGLREYFVKTMLTKKPYISKPYLSSKTKKPTIMVTSPILNENDEVVGMIGGAINLLSNNPLGILRKQKVDKEGYFYIYSKERTIILHPDENRIMKNDVPPGVNKVFDMGLEGFRGAMENINSRGLRVVTGVHPVDSAGWILGLNVPIGIVYENVDRFLWFVNSIFSIIAIFITAFLYFHYTFFIKPLFRVIEEINVLSKEDRIGKIRYNSNLQEMYALISSVNRLVSLISKKHGEMMSFLNTTKDMFLQQDLDGNVLLYNEAFRRFFKIADFKNRGSYLTSSELLDMVGNLGRYKILKGILEEINNKTNSFSSVLNFKDESGENYLKLDVIFVNEADFKGFFTTIQDVTKENLLTNELEGFKIISEQSPLGILITGPDTTISYVNRAAELITGYTAEELIGKKPSVLKSGETSDKVYEKLWKDLRDFNRHECEFINKRKNGETYFEKNIISPIFDGEGRLINYIALKEDVTIKKKYEEQQMRIDKLESIGMLSAKVSHDFKNLLTGFTNFVEIVKIKSSDEGLLKLCDSVKKTLEKSTRITRQLMSLGKQDITVKEVVDIYELVAETAELTLGNKSLTYKIFGERGKFFVEADRDQITQVVLNLLINAYEAIDKMMGLITINIYKKEEQGETFVCVDIKDNGPGIPDSIKNKIFTPFFTTKKNGTGIGLLSCKSIVEEHGGNLSFESGEGEGATFRVCLRECRIENNLACEYKGVKRDDAKLAIIDDNEDIRLSTKMFFEAAGIKCMDFGSRRKAIEYLSNCSGVERCKHIILTDLNIPNDMDWRDFSIAVKKICENIPLIAFSGVFDEEFKNNYQKFGFTRLVNKPFNFDDLLGIVRGLMQM
mgnify:CR=1 FL=1